MLRDVFPFLLKDDEAIESATIWECSRICAAAKNEQLERSNGVSFVLAKLLVGIGDVARLVGLTQIVTVLMHGFSGSWRLLGATGSSRHASPNRWDDELCGTFQYGRRAEIPSGYAQGNRMAIAPAAYEAIQIDAALDAELRRTRGFTSNRSSNRPRSS
jgi:hypothetical protein